MLYICVGVVIVVILYFKYEQSKINKDLYNNQRILAERLEVEVMVDFDEMV